MKVQQANEGLPSSTDFLSHMYAWSATILGKRRRLTFFFHMMIRKVLAQQGQHHNVEKLHKNSHFIGLDWRSTPFMSS